MVNMLGCTSVFVLMLCSWYSYVHLSVGDPVGTRCTKEKEAPTCVCKTSNGTIDLTKIANFDGTPRFTGVTDANDYVYSYNPCSPFSSNDTCTNVHICQSRSYDSYAIAAYGTEQIWSHNSGYYVYYSATDSLGQLREAFVHLLCDPKAYVTEVTTKGDTEVRLTYEFTLRSAYACPGVVPPPNPYKKCARVLGAPTCVCNSSKGIIDLTKIASYTGTPRFSKIKDHDEPKYDYTYNPCTGFSFPGNSLCKNAQICQTVEFSDTAYIIGKYGTEEMMIDDSGNVSVHYNATAEGVVGVRTAIVRLKCDQSVKTQPTLTTTGDDKIMLQYEFVLTSCHACPGGCVMAQKTSSIN